MPAHTKEALIIDLLRPYTATERMLAWASEDLRGDPAWQQTVEVALGNKAPVQASVPSPGE